MENSENEIGKFRAFAKRKLKNHLEELDTNYQERTPELSAVKKAYQEHEAVLEKELRDRIEALAKHSDESYFKQVLLQIKNNLVSMYHDNATRAYANIVKRVHE